MTVRVNVHVNFPVFFFKAVATGHPFVFKPAGILIIADDPLNNGIDHGKAVPVAGFSRILLNEDVRNKTAKLYYGVIANQEVPGAAWQPGVSWQTGVTWQPTFTLKQIIVEEFLRYIIGGWELRDDNVARINLTNELILWNKKNLRTQSSSCQWAFKGTECAYAGAETWCGAWRTRRRNRDTRRYAMRTTSVRTVIPGGTLRHSYT